MMERGGSCICALRESERESSRVDCVWCTLPARCADVHFLLVAVRLAAAKQLVNHAIWINHLPAP